MGFGQHDKGDGWQLGLHTRVILDGCHGIEFEPGDIDHSLDEIKRVGVLLKLRDLQPESLTLAGAITATPMLVSATGDG